MRWWGNWMKAAIDDLVRSWPITTVLGPGGVGKTTVVSALVAEWRAAGSEAVLVRLDRVSDPNGLGAAVTTALGLSDAAGDGAVTITDFDAATDGIAIEYTGGADAPVPEVSVETLDSGVQISLDEQPIATVSGASDLDPANVALVDKTEEEG